MEKIPVNKVPYNGPTSMEKIFNAIVEDAQRESLDHIDFYTVKTVIHYAFTIRCALRGMLYLVPIAIKGLGRFYPDKKDTRLRLKFLEEQTAYKLAFRKKLAANRAILRRSKAMYWKYRETSQAQILMNYTLWKKHTGRQELHDRKYRELNKIRRDFVKRANTRYKLMNVKDVKKKKNYR